MTPPLRELVRARRGAPASMSAMTSVESGAPRAEPAPAADANPLDAPQAGARALRGSSMRIGGFAITMLLSLAAVPLLIRHLGNVDYGRYLTIVSLVAIVASLTEGGLNAIAIRDYTTTEGLDRGSAMRDALGVRLVLTSLGALAAVGFSAAAGYGAALVLGTALASAGMLLQLVQALFAVSLESELRFGRLTMVEVVRQIVNVALLIALVLAGAGVVELLAVAIPASAVSLLLTAWLVRGRISMRPVFVPRRWWPLVRDSIPWAIVAAINVVYFRLALIIMSIVASALETGYFAISFRIVEVLVLIPALAIGAAYPILTRTAHGNIDRFSYAGSRMFELSLVAGTWMVVCVEIGAQFAIHVLAGRHSDPSIAVLRIQAPAILATFVGMACGFPLLTLRRFRQVLLANFAALLLSCALTLVLVGPLGARGAAAAAVSAEFLLAGLQIGFLLRAAPSIRPAPLSAPAVVLAGLIAIAVGLLLPVHPILGVLIGSGVYLLLLRLLGRFPPELREILAARLGSAIR
jgi:O-antigen/teichoic acid export membrane protein